jgi:hypothetical protein
MQGVKAKKPTVEKKSADTLIVEKHRPCMNKLTPTERQQMQKAKQHSRLDPLGLVERSAARPYWLAFWRWPF